MDRLTVGASFVGWDKITHIINKAKEPLTKLLILSLFLTGGRTQEVLSLTKENFDFNISKHCIVMNDMRLDKKYKRIAPGKTEKVYAKRDSYPILYMEPLASRLREDVQSLDRDKLFPNLTRQLSYYYVTKAGKDAGVRVSDHWFRGQRASQLREEYLFQKDECNIFFGWTKPASDMFSHYSATTWTYLLSLMVKGMMARDDVEKFLSKPAV